MSQFSENTESLDEVNIVNVNLLGVHFTLSSSEDKVKILTAIEEYSSYLEQAKKYAPFKDELRLAIFAGILATFQLGQNRQEATQFEKEALDLEAIINQLEKDLLSVKNT